jgi:protein-S-isoprenylcysteine O-methyltransferase Ste14
MMLVLKTLFFTVIAPGTLTILLPWLILPPQTGLPDEVNFFSFLGFFLILAGVASYCWCAWEFIATGKGTPAPYDPPRALVARGLYRMVRNPMYVGVSAIIVGEAALFKSIALLVYAAVAMLAFHLRVIYYEEPTLKRLFGDSWEEYRRRVPRWIPRVALRQEKKNSARA